jgi:hypothetical protein
MGGPRKRTLYLGLDFSFKNNEYIKLVAGLFDDADLPLEDEEWSKAQLGFKVITRSFVSFAERARLSHPKFFYSEVSVSPLGNELYPHTYQVIAYLNHSPLFKLVQDTALGAAISELNTASSTINDDQLQNLSLLEKIRDDFALRHSIQLSMLQSLMSATSSPKTDDSITIKAIQAQLSRIESKIGTTATSTAPSIPSSSQNPQAQKRKADQAPTDSSPPKKPKLGLVELIVEILNDKADSIARDFDHEKYADEYRIHLARTKNPALHDHTKLIGIRISGNGNVVISMHPSTPLPAQTLAMDIFRRFIDGKYGKAVAGTRRNLTLAHLVGHGGSTRAGGVTITQDQLAAHIMSFDTFKKCGTIHEARWITRGWESSPFANFTIGFEDPDGSITRHYTQAPANSVFLAKTPISFKEFFDVPSLALCTKCFMYGHKFKKCKGKAKCRYCSSEAHSGDEHSSNCRCGPCVASDSIRDPYIKESLINTCKKILCTACGSAGHHTGMTTTFCSKKEQAQKRIDAKIPEEHKNLRASVKKGTPLSPFYSPRWTANPRQQRKHSSRSLRVKGCLISSTSPAISTRTMKKCRLTRSDLMSGRSHTARVASKLCIC